MVTGKPIELELGDKSYTFNGYASNVSFERDAVDVTMVGDSARQIMPLGGRVHVTYELGGPVSFGETVPLAPALPLNESLTYGKHPFLVKSHGGKEIDLDVVMPCVLKFLGLLMWVVGWFLYARMI